MPEQVGEDPLLSSYSLVTVSKPPSGKDVMTFGKHLGKTYNTVWATDPSYCQWAMQTVESGDPSSADLSRFARYVAQREAQIPINIPAGRVDEELQTNVYEE